LHTTTQGRDVQPLISLTVEGKTVIESMAPAPTLSTVLIEPCSDGVALFSYNQPKIANAFTLQQYIDLRDALIWARETPEVRVVVL
jgi:1,4-dihydroxy-2-naphthoyl-CoA synthase